MKKRSRIKSDKRAEAVAKDAVVIEKQLSGQLSIMIQEFKDTHPGCTGYMYIEGRGIVLSLEKPEPEDSVIHVVRPQKN